jgi:hypothetical protein
MRLSRSITVALLGLGCGIACKAWRKETPPTPPPAAVPALAGDVHTEEQWIVTDTAAHLARWQGRKPTGAAVLVEPRAAAPRLSSQARRRYGHVDAERLRLVASELRFAGRLPADAACLDDLRPAGFSDAAAHSHREDAGRNRRAAVEAAADRARQPLPARGRGHSARRFPDARNRLSLDPPSTE